MFAFENFKRARKLAIAARKAAAEVRRSSTPDMSAAPLEHQGSRRSQTSIAP